MPRLRMTLVCEFEVRLEDYEAKTAQEAADNAKKYLDEGLYGLNEVILWADEVLVKIEHI